MRLSVTDVEKVRFHLGAREEMRRTDLDLVEDLVPSPPTEAQKVGIIVHKWLESRGQYYQYPINDSKVDVKLPSWSTNEEKRTREVLPGVTLVGQVDAIAPPTLYEYKTTSKRPDPSLYLDAYQWRAYLTLHPLCRCVEYHVLQVRHKGGVIHILDHASSRFWRPDDVDQQVEEATREAVYHIEALIFQGWLTLDDRGKIAAGQKWEHLQALKREAKLIQEKADLAPEVGPGFPTPEQRHLDQQIARLEGRAA